MVKYRVMVAMSLVVSLTAGCGRVLKESCFGRVGPRSSVVYTMSEFDISLVRGIVLYSGEEMIAVIEPHGVVLQADGSMYGGWRRIDFEDNEAISRWGRDVSIMLRARLASSDDELYLPGSQKYIHIGYGSSDNLLAIVQSSDSGARFDWKYYAGAGEVASGEVGWILRE